MTPDAFASLALAKPGAWADQPWEGDDVAKVGPPVGAKIFAFLGSETVGLKCGADREEADEWLLRFPEDASVMAYVGRHGWNSLRLDGGIPDEDLIEALDRSYELVVAGMPKRARPAGWDATASRTG
jgi:predicted DNA-binding protein (MmcQ/YjbR family)